MIRLCLLFIFYLRVSRVSLITLHYDVSVIYFYITLEYRLVILCSSEQKFASFISKLQVYERVFTPSGDISNFLISKFSMSSQIGTHPGSQVQIPASVVDHEG